MDLKSSIPVLAALLLMGCATSVIDYRPSPAMSITDSVETIEELTTTQHRAWRPNFIEINDKYLLWDYGTVSRGLGSAVVVGHVAIGSSRTTTRGSSERIYFKSIERVELRSWIRKFRQWYVVTAVMEREKRDTHLLRTRDLEDAKRYTDAFRTLLAAYGK